MTTISRRTVLGRAGLLGAGIVLADGLGRIVHADKQVTSYRADHLSSHRSGKSGSPRDDRPPCLSQSSSKPWPPHTPGCRTVI